MEGVARRIVQCLPIKVVPLRIPPIRVTNAEEVVDATNHAIIMAGIYDWTGTVNEIFAAKRRQASPPSGSAPHFAISAGRVARIKE